MDEKEGLQPECLAQPEADEMPAECLPGEGTPELLEQKAPGDNQEGTSAKECPRESSTNGLVIGLATGMAVGVLAGFLLRQWPLSIAAGLLLGGAAGLLLDVRKDRKQPQCSVPLSDDGGIATPGDQADGSEE